MTTGNEKIKQYLLGNLAEEEARELDLRIVAEPALEEEFLLAEDDLIDDYLDGILSPADAELFRTNFLVTDERFAALRQMQNLKRYARRAALQPEEESARIANGGWLDNLKSIFRLNSGAAKAVFAVLLVCAAVGAGWRLIFYNQADDRLAQANQEGIRLNREDLSDLSRFENSYKVTLTAGVYRNSDAVRHLPADRFENVALFRLLLPTVETDASVFNVRLMSREGEILTLERVRSYENPDGRELRVLFPAAVVGKGDYRVEVAEENAASPLVYSFTVR